MIDFSACNSSNAMVIVFFSDYLPYITKHKQNIFQRGIYTLIPSVTTIVIITKGYWNFTVQVHVPA